MGEILNVLQGLTLIIISIKFYFLILELCVDINFVILRQFLQFSTVCRLLEQEKREHTDLKCTWQMANDQFLESQRLMMMDMRRMETVLSAEQQRRLTGQAHLNLSFI